MISKIKGRVAKKTEDKVYIESGDFIYEVVIPRSVFLRLPEYINDGKVQLSIYHYLQTDKQRFYPVLVGFLSELEKEFFEKILKVSGIGPKAALRVLNKSISEISEAIDRADIAYLNNLPGVGLQRAKNIVAVLQGKMGKFTLIKDRVISQKQVSSVPKELAEEAEQVLVQLQYKKALARGMIEKAFKSNPDIDSIEDLLNQIYRQRI